MLTNGNVSVYCVYISVCLSKHIQTWILLIVIYTAVLEMRPDLSSVYGRPEDATAWIFPSSQQELLQRTDCPT